MPNTARNTVHGIDLTAPGGIEALLAFHRAHFGDTRMEEGDGSGGDSGGDGGDGSDDGDNGAGGPGSDGNKPIAEMTDAERADYFKAKAERYKRGYEKRADYDALKEKADRHDALERELMSDKEKAVLEAQEAAKAETLKTVTPKLVAAEFKVAAAGRIDADRLKEILEPLDLSKFLTKQGEVDEAKVASYVEGIAPAGPVQRRGPSSVGLGNRQHSNGSPGDQGRAMAAKRFGTPA